MNTEVLDEQVKEVETPTQEPSVTKELSEKDLKVAYVRALKERKEKIKQNKEMLAEMQLEVDFWKAQSDLLKYRFEKMDYYLRNLELEPRYLQAVEEQKLKSEQSLDQSPEQTILD